MAGRFLVCVVLLAASAAATALAAQDARRVPYRLQPLGGSMAGPTYVTAPRPADGRLYVVHRAGSVRTFARGRLARTRFLDIRRQVGTAGERGLFSLAFHPDYASNRRFYVCYTDRGGAVVVAEFRSDGTRTVPGSQRILVRVPHPDSPFHNGGQIAFGPDGRLYVGVGDGGYGDAPPRDPDPGGNAQNLNVLLGKIFALDVAAADPRPEIVAYGLRNPWRFSLVPGTNAFVVADVGFRDREEINYLRLDPGRLVNFGWSVYEGRRARRDASRPLNPRGDLTWPIYTYLTNLRGNCSIIGGYVYRGSIRSLRGRYVFGDYCSGRIWSIRVTPTGAAGLRREPVTVSGLASFGEDARGELYAMSVDYGRVYRFARR